MARRGNAGAFETIVDRYQGRLLGFCRQMLGSTEDAEDVLQEVFVNAYRAMLADSREINLRPWLYRIARNRCLNHLRKPTADSQESMDMVPAVEAASTAEKVHNREEFRQLLSDVGKLPETQRTALILRELDAMSYEEIAQAMDASVPSIKSLLVRARISLAEASQARQLTCGEVRLALAEAAEGLRKVSGPVRRHVRDCDECDAFRSMVRSNDKVLAAMSPVGPLLAMKSFILSKLGLGGAGGGAGAGASAGAGATVTATGTGAVGSVGAAIGSGSAASGIGAVGGAIGTKAVASVVTAAMLTAGAVEVKEQVVPAPTPKSASASTSHSTIPPRISLADRTVAPTQTNVTPDPAPVEATSAVATPESVPPAPSAPETADTTGLPTEPATTNPVGPGVTAAKPPPGTVGAPSGSDVVVVTVGGGPTRTPSPEPTTPPAEPAPPASESPPPPPSEPAPTPEPSPSPEPGPSEAPPPGS
ncbi:MAG: sigma-70 family RNA polymerase sigma factor [Solirubrobacterales bacterium]